MLGRYDMHLRTSSACLSPASMASVKLPHICFSTGPGLKCCRSNTCISSLPPGITALKGLQELQLGACSFKSVPAQLLRQLAARLATGAAAWGRAW